MTPTAQTGGTSQIINTGLKQDRTHEYTLKVERQLVPNVAVNAGYVRHSVFNMYDSATNAGVQNPTATYVGNGIDVGHTYNVPVVFSDTFNGVTTPVTVYTYVKGSGTLTNEVVNNPSNRPDVYNSFEVAVTKRYSKRWSWSRTAGIGANARRNTERHLCSLWHSQRSGDCKGANGPRH